MTLNLTRGKQYEYFNKSSDSDIDEIGEEEKVSDTLKRYRRTIQTSSHENYQKILGFECLEYTRIFYVIRNLCVVIFLCFT